MFYHMYSTPFSHINLSWVSQLPYHFKLSTTRNIPRYDLLLHVVLFVLKVKFMTVFHFLYFFQNHGHTISCSTLCLVIYCILLIISYHYNNINVLIWHYNINVSLISTMYSICTFMSSVYQCIIFLSLLKNSVVPVHHCFFFIYKIYFYFKITTDAYTIIIDLHVCNLCICILV